MLIYLSIYVLPNITKLKKLRFFDIFSIIIDIFIDLQMNFNLMKQSEEDK